MISVARSDPKDPKARALLQESHALMDRLFPAEANHYLDVEALNQPNITFFMASRGEDALGTGALCAEEGYGEIKSMYVAKDARRQGVAKKILMAIEAEARRQKLPKLMLESGDALKEALKMYERHGFRFRGAFGPYKEEPSSIFMEKDLL